MLSRQSGAQPVIVLNKADLSADVTAVVRRLRHGARRADPWSALDGRGLEWLGRIWPRARPSRCWGPRVGKSSIVNRLVGHSLLETGEVRAWDSRGRHTSVHRQMIVLERGGVLIDTPGLRELQFWLPDESLDQVFGDIDSLAVSCRFRDCRHATEPGCAVKAAVADGGLDSSRYESYRTLAAERDALAAQQTERALIEKKRQGRIMQKAYRAFVKKKGRE